MMSLQTSRHGRSQTFRSLVAILCVLLILFVGAAQVLHSHAQEEAANPGCGLCAVAHVSALPAPVLGSPVVVEAVASFAQQQAIAAPQRFISFSNYVRPPPALTAHS